MIISASYKTDIPAFYGEWFLNRLRAGFCRTANPFNRKQRSVVSLRREDVDGCIFWTKNIAPFVDALGAVHDAGLPFLVQYTINGYPRSLESRVVDAEKSVAQFRALSDQFGKRVPIWRYDTIIFSTITDADFHRRNFETLASGLAGATDEVVVSFMQLYDKTRRNMDRTAQRESFEWEDPPADKKRALLHDLATIATDHGMRLTLCTHPDLLISSVGEARCIDAARLMDVVGQPIRAKLKGMRTGCGCFESKDIGDYDTCPHGCVYCYAVRNREVALRRYQEHDPEGEYLFPQTELPDPEPVTSPARNQLPLFPDSPS